MMHGVKTARVWALGMCAAAAAAGAAGCGTGTPAPQATGAAASAQVGAAAGDKYPEPRWPSYFKPPKSMDDLMPAARSLVRNQSGLQGKGLGILQPGEKVLIVVADKGD